VPLFELYCLIERYLRFRNWISFLLVFISGLSEVGILKLCTCSFKDQDCALSFTHGFVSVDIEPVVSV
jgi:hypothetical protein